MVTATFFTSKTENHPPLFELHTTFYPNDLCISTLRKGLFLQTADVLTTNLLSQRSSGDISREKAYRLS